MTNLNNNTTELLCVETTGTNETVGSLLLTLNFNYDIMYRCK
jgi:hypothetical protein